MSDDDRQRWNARYRDGAFDSRPHPNAFLATQAASFPSASHILDLACGSGRNARYLAGLGHTVHAVDIADEGLAKVQGEYAQAISIEQADLESESWEPSVSFDAIVILRYLNLPLIARAAQWLKPGGLLVVEVHLQHSADGLVGPATSRFRAEPGALAQAAGGLESIVSSEGLITDPDGGTAAVARLVAGKPR